MVVKNINFGLNFFKLGYELFLRFKIKGEREREI